MTGFPEVRWARWSDTGYEVSSRGDTRFSALFATMPDGRTIEAHYQCDIKGFAPGSSEWKPFKGKTNGKRPSVLWTGYFCLWRLWAASNPDLMDELESIAQQHDNVLTDRFAKTEINQAHALAKILTSRRLREWQLL